MTFDSTYMATGGKPSSGSIKHITEMLLLYCQDSLIVSCQRKVCEVRVKEPQAQSSQLRESGRYLFLKLEVWYLRLFFQVILGGRAPELVSRVTAPDMS
jgi:hypothetical protein